MEMKQIQIMKYLMRTSLQTKNMQMMAKVSVKMMKLLLLVMKVIQMKAIRILKVMKVIQMKAIRILKVKKVMMMKAMMKMILRTLKKKVEKSLMRSI